MQDWGGLVAEIARFDDFAAAEADSGSHFGSLLVKLTAIDRAPRTPSGFVDAILRCNFSAADYAYLSSPKLDGLFKAIYNKAPHILESGAWNDDSLLHGVPNPTMLRLMLGRIAANPAFAAAAVTLMEHGADLRLGGGQELAAAAGAGNLQVMTHMLDRWADVHAQQDEALMRAVRRGRYEAVDLLLQRGASADARDNTAIRTAIRRGDVGLTHLLLLHGACFHASMSQRTSALRDASRLGKVDMIEFLLARGADVHVGQDIALRSAVRYGHLESVRALLRHNAHVNALSGEPLIIAARQGHLAVAECLLKAGADMNAKQGRPLLLAASTGSVEMMGLLLSYHAQSDHALAAAAGRGDMNTVKLLLDHGLDIHTSQDDALHRALTANRQQMVTFLLERGANARSRSDAALETAARLGNVPLMQMLMDRGVEVTGAALQAAAGAKKIDALQFLLKSNHVFLQGDWNAAFLTAVTHNRMAATNALVNLAYDHDGVSDGLQQTMITFAVEQGSDDLVRFLLDHSRDRAGALNCALSAAVDQERCSIAKWLTSKMKFRPTTAHVTAAARHDSSRMLKILCDGDIDLDANDGAALTTAVVAMSPACVRFLLARGANVHAGNDAALIAAAGGVPHQIILEMLLRAGANVHAQGDRAIYLAATQRRWGSKHVVRVLMRHGANPRAWPHSALSVATDQAIIDELLDTKLKRCVRVVGRIVRQTGLTVAGLVTFFSDIARNGTHPEAKARVALAVSIGVLVYLLKEGWFGSRWRPASPRPR